MDEGPVALSSMQRSKIRRIASVRAVARADEGGELALVPFLDILMNVLLFVIATIPVAFTSTLLATLPPSGPGRVQKRPVLGLSVLVTSEGLGVKAAAGNIAPGCSGLGAGLTLPSEGGELPWAKLRACVEKIRAEAGEIEDERAVVIIAEPAVEYQAVVRAIDAVREGDDGTPLFDDVRFGAPR
jgi:biopolymer transport protein TolR